MRARLRSALEDAIDRDVLVRVSIDGVDRLMLNTESAQKGFVWCARGLRWMRIRMVKAMVGMLRRLDLWELMRFGLMRRISGRCHR